MLVLICLLCLYVCTLCVCVVCVCVYISGLSMALNPIDVCFCCPFESALKAALTL